MPTVPPKIEKIEVLLKSSDRLVVRYTLTYIPEIIDTITDMHPQDYDIPSRLLTAAGVDIRIKGTALTETEWKDREWIFTFVPYAPELFSHFVQQVINGPCLEIDQALRKRNVHFLREIWEVTVRERIDARTTC